MKYPYMTLADETEITHSEMMPNGQVEIFIETPVPNGFHSVKCILPAYVWTDNQGYSDRDLAYFRKLVKNNAHLILEYSQKGGVLGATAI